MEAVRVPYTNTFSTILTPDGKTEPIDILAGILQGDTLAPFLFLLVLDYVLRKSLDLNYSNGLQLHPRKSSRVPSVHLTDADFADDLALIGSPDVFRLRKEPINSLSCVRASVRALVCSGPTA